MMMVATHTLCKEERLHGKRAIDGLFEHAQSFYAFPYKVLWRKINVENFTHPVSFAISVPKRRIKKAVGRNLIKRRTREAYRLNKQILISELTAGIQIHCMLIYTSGELLLFADIEGAMKKILHQISIQSAKSN